MQIKNESESKLSGVMSCTNGQATANKNRKTNEIY